MRVFQAVYSASYSMLSEVPSAKVDSEETMSSVLELCLKTVLPRY